MKREEIANSLKDTIHLCRRYLRFETDYLKLSLTEKLTLLLSGIGLGLVICMLVLFTVFMASMALAVTFKEFMTPWLAYLSVAGIFIIIGVIVFFLRKPLIFNPFAKFISKIILDKKIEDNDKRP